MPKHTPKPPPSALQAAIPTPAYAYWNPAKVAAMVWFGQIVVLRVAPSGVQTFNETLRQKMHEFRPGSVQFGIADISDLNPADPDHTKAVRAWRHQIGWDDLVEAPFGYYCFRRGELVAYHPGLPEDDDPNAQTAKGVVSLVGLFGALVTKGATRDSWLNATYAALESEPGRKVAEFFQGAIRSVESAEATRKAEEEAAKRRAAQTKVETDQLAGAYRLLGVNATASDEDIKRAHRSAAVRIHPDMGPESEKEKRTLLMQQLNVAYELIKRKRGIR